MEGARRRQFAVAITVLVAAAASQYAGPVRSVSAIAPAASTAYIPDFAVSASRAPLGVAAGPDGNMWFTEGSRIGRIAADFTVTQFLMPSAARAQASAIAAGPDGNLWFTELPPFGIGRITPSGSVAEFPIPRAPVIDRLTSRITAGPDGNVWFSEPDASQIARITPAGTITEFPVALGDGYSLGGIAAGPDGNLWFTRTFAHSIGQLTPSGVQTNFAVTGEPIDIALGPDGNLWFTEHDVIGKNQAIGRITPGGVVTEFPLADSIQPPPPQSGITRAADGNLWFLDSTKVGRITPSGVVSEFDLPSNTGESWALASAPGTDPHLWFTASKSTADPDSDRRVEQIDLNGAVTHVVALPTSQPSHLATGPDGNLWVTTPGENQITRLSAPPLAYPDLRQFREFPLPAANSDPEGIILGPDGNLWFAERGSSKIGRLTTAGVLTEFPISAGAAPSQLTAGSDGNLWFTEPGTSSIGRMSVTGTGYTEYPTPTPASEPRGIALGSSGDLWFTEYKGSRIGHITTAGQATEITLPSSNALPDGIVSGPDGNIWLTETGNSSLARVSATGDVTEFPLTAPGSSTVPRYLAAGADGNLWVTEPGNNQLARVSPAGAVTTYSLPRTGAEPLGITTGSDGWIWFAERAVDRVGRIGWSKVLTSVSTSQYSLHASDGQSWTDMDSEKLALTVRPLAATTAVISANTDLWTAEAGFNQDVGISVDGQVATWKESGGRAGPFSPNAAFAQIVQTLSAGHTYLIKVQWKTNRPDPNGTIFAGAGLGPVFSPTRLTVQLLPFAPLDSGIAAQKSLSNSDGNTWVDVSPVTTPHFTPLHLSFYPYIDGTAVITGNVDLWTATAGVNQDIGISVDGSIVAWKESGGRIATFSPNAAFVQAAVPVRAGPHTAALQWKTNRPNAGGTIFAGAGLGPVFSPTVLTVRFFPTGLTDAASTKQYLLAGSDGATWVPVDQQLLGQTFTPTFDCAAVLSANADLFTANPGINQDIAISVNDKVVAWKESGGSAGTFSPNAAFVQTIYPMTAGTPYRVSLKWKTNVADPGGTIMAGAGLGPAFSPTRLTIQCGDELPVDAAFPP